MRRLFTSFIFSLFVLNQLVAQGTMHKQHGHFTAHLDFFNNHPFKDTKGRIPHPLPLTTNGLKNTSEVWYEEKGVKVKGLIQSAAMQVDWWLLFGEPTEQYEFQWVSSGYYDIVFTDKKGKAVNARISKDKLAKYPDLLKRFNNLAPTALDFEINWRIGSQTDADREAFKQRYKLLGSIGSSMPHLNSSFKTTVKNSGLLFEPSGIKPFAVPGIGGGKGRDFLGLAANYDETKLSQIFAYWKISTGQVIQNFSATKNDWPVDEMKAIAEKYLAYENGEEDPTPKEQIAKADEKNKSTQAYGKDDFWGDAMEEESNIEIFNESNEVGIKRKNIIIRKFDASKFEIYAMENKKIFKLVNKCLYDNSIHIMLISFLNERGELIKINDNLEFYDTPESCGESAIFLKKSESDVIRELLYVHSFSRNFPSKIKSTYAEVNNAILNYDNSGGVSSLRYFFQIMELEKLYIDFNKMSIIKKETVFRPFYKKWTQKNETKNRECY